MLFALLQKQDTKIFRRVQDIVSKMDNGVTFVGAIEKRLAFVEKFIIFRKNKSGKYIPREVHMNEADLKFLREAFAVAQRAREHGNHPFGAILVDANGAKLLEAENTVITDRDCVGHAETNLLREASRRFDANVLAKCTVYASAEPCAMCAGAIYWSGVNRLVYGLSKQRLSEIQNQQIYWQLFLPCREVFARGQREIAVEGPALEAEAELVHKGYWQ